MRMVFESAVDALCRHPLILSRQKAKRAGPAYSESRPPSNFVSRRYALNELPQPHVDLVFGFENLKPEPSIDST